MKTLVPLLTVLLLVAACSDSSDSMPLAPEALNLNAVGYGGTVDGVPRSLTNDGEYDSVFPSTNALNIASESPNVTWSSNDANIGTAPLRFATITSGGGCFEYRIDDEAAIPGEDNPNPGIKDGRWAEVCVGFFIGETLVLPATSHVDVRFSGDPFTEAHSFDWTRFYAMTLNSRDQCKDGSWQDLGFQNQGQCIRFMETGKDSR